MRKISFCETWGFWSLFSRAPIKTFSSELFYTTYYIIALEKCEKECNMLEIILVKGFVHWKLKLLSLLMDFILNYLPLFGKKSWFRGEWVNNNNIIIFENRILFTCRSHHLDCSHREGNLFLYFYP